MRRLPARLAALLSSTALVSALAVTLAAPAEAAPPVVVDDELTIYANTIHFPDLLANDTDPDGDDLKVCRLQEVLEPPVLFVDLLGMPVVGAESGTSGVFEFTYYACDYETLVPGTLTVTVKPSPKMALTLTKLKKRPGKLRITNKGGFGVDFAWGHANRAVPDGTIRLGKKSSKVITVRRTAITWYAFNEDNGAEKSGYLRGITLPKKGKQLPPSPRPRYVSAPLFGLTDSASLSTPLQGVQAWRAPLRGLTQR